MPSRRPIPIPLRPPSMIHRRWLWVMIALGIILIAVGWMITIRDIRSSSAPAIQEAIQENLEKAASGIKEASEEVDEKGEDWERIFESVKAGYEAEKARQTDATVGETNP